MPWEIVKQGDKHCVVKKGSGEVVKCHPTEPDAMAHMQALYANVEDAVRKGAGLPSKGK